MVPVKILSYLSLQLCYLDVDEKLPKVARRHDNGGVELNNITLVQCNIVVGGQSLENKQSSLL